MQFYITLSAMAHTLRDNKCACSCYHTDVHGSLRSVLMFVLHNRFIEQDVEQKLC